MPPAEIEAGLRRTGLLGALAVLDRAAPLPTLGELVDSGRRLVVFAEEDGARVPGTRPRSPSSRTPRWAPGARPT